MTKKIFNFQFSIFNSSKGFTLVEMLIAVSLFVVIVSFSLGSLVSVFNANKNAQSSKTVVDNLNLSLENMARTIRFGKNYHCGSDGTLSSPRDCPDNINGDTFFAVTFESKVIIYRLNGTTIQKSSDGGGSYEDITAPEAKIENLKFYVFGSFPSDNAQPYVVVVIKGYAGSKSDTQSSFSVETLISQRTIDI
jgi:prepilin-type N-terminal cleavage/methylation domain-containing protein